MFTVEQIENAHSKVQSGADFPNYIKEIKDLGVKSFEIWVKDSHTEYFGDNGYTTKSKAKYADLTIENSVDEEKFIKQLKSHQKGETDYMEFCEDCAETGIEKWIVNLNNFTCVYYDKAGNEILMEEIPH
ncbi:Uncharacterized conserved protein YbcV, DUF1398 family [Chryseobacterium taeanense]|uniref:Uncharacterized conserved protein YbcV, DUF1398 family n=1 Tax=Chryseobacterium taeanense TaxID=311334 RepID=A0A1G8PFD8_9FLAO|nr:DUF1398 family protein [Chryseobacterium taeanense]SDI91127.1 Uncharacterized conserved protein YbcV, DUF1398 family [Chryseobacterium taeanense]